MSRMTGSARIAKLALATSGVVLTLLGAAASESEAAPPAKNVILLISDGAGYNPHGATALWNGFTPTYQTSSDWTKYNVSTYPLRTGTTPIAGPAGLAQDPNAVYDPLKAWDTTPVATTTGGYPDHFAGYKWNKDTAPDSANTMVSVQTGVKTYNNAVNVNGNGTPLFTFAESAKLNYGKSVGIATTVEWPDATPSVNAGAHNISRANRGAIADEMLNAGIADVIMGGGNPDYDNDGTLRAAPLYAANGGWINQSTWTDLKNGTNPNWELHQDKADFEALAAGTLAPGKKFLGTFKSFNSTQENRSGGSPNGNANTPNNDNAYLTPRRTDVPSLPTMVQGSLNLLGQNPNGFFAMFEGGAVDRAEHDNKLGRMIEEQTEFDQTVAAIEAYLDGNTDGNNWSNTLVVVTADHDHLLLGPDSDTNAFSSLTSNGVGNLPGFKFQSNGHSNRLVPMWARGVGAELFGDYADQMDAAPGGLGFGSYLDQTEINAVFNSVVPEPASIATIGLAAVSMLGVRRRRI